MKTPKPAVTLLRCEHVSWGMYAILSTPAVAFVCALATVKPTVQFCAGCVLGVWLGMWLVVFWAWLTRKKAAESEPAEESL